MIGYPIKTWHSGLRARIGGCRTSPTQHKQKENRTHALMGKNGVKHEFTDLFGVEGGIFLKELDLPRSQRIALDVLLRQLEFMDNEIEQVQKQIAVIARVDEDIKILTESPNREQTEEIREDHLLS